MAKKSAARKAPRRAKPLKILIVGDPFPLLKRASDSSLAFAQSALERQHQVAWCLDTEIGLVASEPWACLHPMTLSPSGPQILPEREERPICWFDLVLIRKDPPFQSNYVRLCWLLSLVEKRVYIANRPSLLLRYHEKLLALEAFHQGVIGEENIIPTYLGHFQESQSRIREHLESEIVTKPFLGFAGQAVRKDPTGKIAASLGSVSEDSLFQPYQDEVQGGDIRILYLGGKALGHFHRLPAKGDFVSNLARGGTAEVRPLTARQKKVMQKVGLFLRRLGIDFAGVDLIGERLSEINITSPTGIPAYRQLTGKDLSGTCIQYWERKVRR